MKQKSVTARIAAVLLALVLLCPLLALPASAAPSGTMSSLVTSYYDSDEFDMVLSGRTLTFTHLPAQNRFTWIWVVVNKDENAVPEFANMGQPVSVELPALPDGTYSFEIYYASQRYGTYLSYLYNDVMVTYQGGEIGFLTPAVLQNNRSLTGSTSPRDPIGYLGSNWLVESADPEITALAANITAGITSNYEKARAIHDWLVENIYYDSDSVNNGTVGIHSALDALHARRTVCYGISNLGAALLRACQIPCRVVLGVGLGITSTYAGWGNGMADSTEANHAWNEFYVNGRWMLMDATWDIMNEYENSTDTYGGLSDRRYFDCSMEYFSYTHKLLTIDPMTLPPAARQTTYMVNVTCGENGSATASALLMKGDSFTVTVAPNAGYQVADVVVNGASIGAKAMFTLDNITQETFVSITFKAL